MAGDVKTCTAVIYILLCLAVPLVPTCSGQLPVAETEALLGLAAAFTPTRINAGTIVDTWDPTTDPCNPPPNKWLGADARTQCTDVIIVEHPRRRHLQLQQRGHQRQVQPMSQWPSRGSRVRARPVVALPVRRTRVFPTGWLALSAHRQPDAAQNDFFGQQQVTVPCVAGRALHCLC